MMTIFLPQHQPAHHNASQLAVRAANNDIPIVTRKRLSNNFSLCFITPLSLTLSDNLLSSVRDKAPAIQDNLLPVLSAQMC